MNLVLEKIEKLRDELHFHNYNYYVLDKPLISDYDFDMKLKDLINLEKKYPQFYDLEKYNTARIVQLSFIVTDRSFNNIDLQDYIIN